MKKLLMITLILTLAGVANATLLTWTDSGGSGITTLEIASVGGTATAYLSADDALTFSTKWLGIDETGTPNVTVQSVTALAAAGNGAIVQTSTQTTYDDYGWTVESTHTGEPPSSVLAGVQYAVVFYGEALGSETAESDNFGTSDQLAITVVPEPMTLSLLGLGGLLLRRKRKA